MTLHLPFIIGLFVFIMSLIWMLESYCTRCWLRFGVILVCVMVSGAFIAIQLYLWLGPQPPREEPMVMHQTTTPI